MTRRCSAGDTEGATSTVVIADFNETLVQQRTLPAWCIGRLRRAPWPERLRVLLLSLPLGALSLLADAAGAETLAARLGFRALVDARTADLVAFARGDLRINPAGRLALERLAAAHGRLRLLVVSRGTPAIVVRAWLETTADWLVPLLGSPPGVMAPEVESRGDRLTGRLLGPPLRKSNRAELLTGDAIFLGDRHDRRWAQRSGARFVAVDPEDERNV